MRIFADKFSVRALATVCAITFERTTLDAGTTAGSTSTTSTSSTSSSSTSTSSTSTAPSSGSPGGLTQAAMQTGTLGAGMYEIPIVVVKDANNNPRPVNGPAMVLNDGETIELSPIYSNSAVVFVSTGGPDGAKNGPRTALGGGANSNPIVAYVRNLADVWVFGATGDGVSVRVKRAHY